MRDIRLAHLDKARPVLILTRESALGAISKVTIAPITSTVKGLMTEVSVGQRNGLDEVSVVACDNLVTIGQARLGRHLGYLFDDQEPELARAVRLAFDLRFGC